MPNVHILQQCDVLITKNRIIRLSLSCSLNTPNVRVLIIIYRIISILQVYVVCVQYLFSLALNLRVDFRQK